MKKFVPIVLSLLLVFCFVLSITPTTLAAGSDPPTRIINVVYDDSGSMYKNDAGVLVDTWCQAKYSMEVFAAMLGDCDTLNVYYMSDYCDGINSAPRLVLHGSDGASVNVGKLHKEKTTGRSTPFNSVRKAYSDLAGAKADDKWLVILTDGAFEDGSMSKSEIDRFLNSKNKDIRVMFLAMGPDAAGITENESNNIFYVEAKTNNQILKQITGICTRVFNSNKLDVNASSKKFSFDIPMGELIVFAQGANVKINGIKKSDGTLIESSKTPVEVKYSECDASNYKDNKPTTDLSGKLATFIDDFPEGDYSVDVSGAETIEIYYKPNVDIAVYLTDSEGNEVTDLSNIEAGEYTISFGFVKSDTKEKVKESKLLGSVSYEATVYNNDIKHDATYSNGDKITVETGSLAIDAIARYLDYHTVSTHLDFSAFENKAIKFESVSAPTYIISTNSIDNGDVPTQVKVLLNSQEMSEEEWDTLSLPDVEIATEGNKGIKELRIEKSDQCGILNIYPVLNDEKTTPGSYKDLNLTLSLSQTVDISSWNGSSSITVPLSDTRSWLEQNADKIIKAAIAGVIIFILLGYTPIFKKRLPKSLKAHPKIIFDPADFMLPKSDTIGSIKKSAVSTFLPYCAQRGTIRYTPAGTSPSFKVKAKSGRRMEITNMAYFKNNDNVLIDGTKINEFKKHKSFSGSIEITTKTAKGTYRCSPNMK